jgi:hypothetical protein
MHDATEEEATPTAGPEPAADKPGGSPTKDEKPKPAWQRFLETSGGTALITVLVGGMFGQFITWTFQEKAKEREFQQEWMKSRGDHALLSYKEYLDGEQELMRHAYELVGNNAAASEDLIEITGEEYAASDNPKTKQQMLEMQKRYNAASAQWRVEGKKLEMLMGYYHQGLPQMRGDWRELSGAVSGYVKCASMWKAVWDAKRNEVPTPEDVDGACGKERGRLDDSIDRLNATQEAGRQYGWKGWNSPEELRRALEGKTEEPPHTPAPSATPPATPPR